jgi:hypothetical protein
MYRAWDAGADPSRRMRRESSLVEFLRWLIATKPPFETPVRRG